MTDRPRGWRDPNELEAQFFSGGDPRMEPPERTFVDESPTLVADQIQADYRAWVARTGRPKPAPPTGPLIGEPIAEWTGPTTNPTNEGEHDND